MPYGYDNGRRARIGVVGVGCCRDEARLADHCVWWGGFTSGPKALLLYTVIRQSTLHYHSKTRITPHITSPLYQIHPSPLLFSVRLDFICGKSRGPTSHAPLIQKCRVLKAKYKLHSSTIEVQSHMRYAVTLRVPLRVCKGGRPLLKPQSSFQFSLPTELKSSRPPSNMAFSKVPAVYGHSESLGAPPSPSNSRSVLLGVALERHRSACPTQISHAQTESWNAT